MLVARVFGHHVVEQLAILLHNVRKDGEFVLRDNHSPMPVNHISEQLDLDHSLNQLEPADSPVGDWGG